MITWQPLIKWEHYSKVQGIEQQRSLQLTEQRAADMASVMGIDMSSAMEAVTGAAKGNYTMMDNLGVKNGRYEC